MTNFKNWTSESVAAFEQKQSARRLRAIENQSVSEARQVFAAIDGAKAAQKPKERKKNPEYQIQADYVLQMEQRHPLVMVFSDTAAHIGKTMFQQIRANKLQSAIAKDWPDVFVAQPSGDYAGLFLEFKAKSPYLKDGVTLSSDKHIRAQAATMDRLRERGYFCAFVWEVSQAFNLTNKYLNQ